MAAHSVGCVKHFTIFKSVRVLDGSNVTRRSNSLFKLSRNPVITRPCRLILFVRRELACSSYIEICLSRALLHW